MAPEQVEGKQMDARTDIFAFGVVMYEMATGKKAFEGESKASLTAAILTYEPPPITKIQPLIPPALERVVKGCLAKDPEDRWQSTRDLSSELKWIADGATPAAVAAAETAGLKLIANRRRRQQLVWALAVTLLIAAIVSTVSYLRLVRAPTRPIISEIVLPEGSRFNFRLGRPVLSPDGGAVAFSAADAGGKTMLWVRSFDSLAAQPLGGTEGGASPFWSANGRWLGFFADGKLKTLELSGGPARIMADAPVNGGGSWNREGTFLFVPDLAKVLYQVAPSAGAPVSVFKLDPSKCRHFHWPKFLPDGKHFLYHARGLDPASSGTYFASLDGKENRLLIKGESRATYGSGYLLYLLDRTLMAQAFDPERGQLEGDARPVAERVAADFFAGGIFDASENAVLIYQGGYTGEERRITWFDRAGKELRAGEKGNYDSLRLSPDGVKLAFKAGNPTTDIWVDELARGVQMRLTNDPGFDYTSPTWSPDGRRILFGGGAGKARPGIYQMNSNGAGGKELLLPAETSDPGMWPTSWSPDARFILFVRGNPANPKQDIWILPIAGDRKPRLFVQNAFDGQFSPDGRWVTYTSMESGKLQIYVVPFDAAKVLNTRPGIEVSPHDKTQISTSFGVIARWGGTEVFYLGPDKQMMAAEVDGRGNRSEGAGSLQKGGRVRMV
jgi:Tol biopolymer transport system component